MSAQESTCLAFLCLFSAIYLSTCAQRSFKVVWINATCISNPNIALITCGTEKVDDNVVMNLDSHVVQDIEEMQAYVTIDALRKNGDSVRIIDTNFDACKFLKDGVKQSLIIIVYTMFKNYGTFPKQCPLLKGQNYTLTNFHLDAEDLPPYTPEGSFRYQGRITSKTEQYLDLIIYGAIVPNKPRKKLSKHGSSFISDMNPLIA